MHHTFLIETFGTAFWASEKAYKCWGRDKELKGSGPTVEKQYVLEEKKKCARQLHHHTDYQMSFFLSFLKICVYIKASGIFD